MIKRVLKAIREAKAKDATTHAEIAKACLALSIRHAGSKEKAAEWLRLYYHHQAKA